MTLNRVKRVTMAGFTALAATVIATPASASATVSCDSLSGSGSYSDPVRLGTVRRTLVVDDCEPLTSGSPYNLRYFTFTLAYRPDEESFAGTRFGLTSSRNAVPTPRLLSGAYTVRRGGTWTGTAPDYTGVYLSLDGLSSGTYRLAVAKLRSPLTSSSTPYFDVIVIP